MLTGGCHVGSEHGKIEKDFMFCSLLELSCTMLYREFACNREHMQYPLFKAGVAWRQGFIDQLVLSVRRSRGQSVSVGAETASLVHWLRPWCDLVRRSRFVHTGRSSVSFIYGALETGETRCGRARVCAAIAAPNLGHLGRKRCNATRFVIGHCCGRSNGGRFECGSRSCLSIIHQELRNLCSAI